MNGVEYRMALKTQNWQEALKLHKEKLNEIAQGKLGLWDGQPSRISTRQRMLTLKKGACTRQRRHDSQTKERCRPVRAFFGEASVATN